MEEIPLTGGGRTVVSRRGDVVLRAAGPWSASVHDLLRHLEGVGYAAAPRVVGTGFDAHGRETLTYVEGEQVPPHEWAASGMTRLGRMVRGLHDAARSFSPPHDATWRTWHGRDLGTPEAGFGHGDLGPWNIVARDGLPHAFIDWETAGPVDPLYDLAQACWLNAQLHDEEVAERVGLPSLATRAEHARHILDGYELPISERAGFVDRMIEFAVHDAVAQVPGVTIAPDTHDAKDVWAVTWRVRSAGWMLRHKPALQHALG